MFDRSKKVTRRKVHLFTYQGKDNTPSAVLVQALLVVQLQTFFHSNRSVIWEPNIRKRQYNILNIFKFEHSKQTSAQTLEIQS